MNHFLSAIDSPVSFTVSRSPGRALWGTACLLALAAVLTGCGPEQEDQLVPYSHAPATAAVQLLSASPSDIRHRQRLSHTPQRRRHTPPAQPQGPAPID